MISVPLVTLGFNKKVQHSLRPSRVLPAEVELSTFQGVSMRNDKRVISIGSQPIAADKNSVLDSLPYVVRPSLGVYLRVSPRSFTDTKPGWAHYKIQ
jgi:hypothetical protein